MAAGTVAKLLHARLGLCELVRVESTDWIVVTSKGVRYRIPPEKRSQFQVVSESPLPTPEPSLETVLSPKSAAARNARRVIESLRVGLPSLDGSTRHLAVGFRETEKFIKRFLGDIDADGGGAMTLKGAYGQGKTFALIMLEEIAHEAGFVTVRTEIDATENRLNKPHHIYHDLMRHLRFPKVEGEGVRCLVQRVRGLLEQRCPGDCYERKRWLDEQLGCFPLAWLFSDPGLMEKPPLVGLLEGNPNYPVSRARSYHIYPPVPRFWPAFTAATQGDFASFILSGIGRLVRLLGYKGLVIIMDEMEKWHDLNWAEQANAGNLLGGLIWAATAEGGRRRTRHDETQIEGLFARDDPPRGLIHSGRCGGYPFTTERRCHVGLAIAMTPRNEYQSDIWSCYGPVLVADVPALTERRLFEYCRLVVPIFARAFGLEPPNQPVLQSIAAEAVRIWKTHGDMNTRSGTQAAIAAFDHWRDRN